MSFILKTDKGYIKRTAHFGEFHGSIILTDKVGDAFKFTRKRDAEARAHVTRWRTREGGGSGHWKTGVGRDHHKFGSLSVEVIEVP